MADDPALFRLFNEIGIIAQLSGTAFERAMPKGMTLPQFIVLNHGVRLGDGRTPAELARAFQVTKATMTSTLGRLARKGLVAVKPDPVDGRAKRVFLTAKGRKMREACVAAIGPGLARINAALETGAVQSLLPGLAKLRAALDQRRDLG